MHEKVPEYHQRFSSDPVYQKILSEVMGTGVYEGAAQEIAVRFYLLLDGAIGWDTTCLSCASVLDSSIAQHEELERIKKELKAIRSTAKSVVLRLATHFPPGTVSVSG